MELDAIVCECLGVTNEAIKDAVDHGARSLEEVQDVTGAATICGACLEEVQTVVDHFLKEREQEKKC